MAIIRLIVTLKILPCKRAIMWRSQHQSLLCCVYMLCRWREAVRDQTICCSGDAGVFCRGKVSSWGSLGVVLLLWYVGPTVWDWGRISPTCRAKIYGVRGLQGNPGGLSGAYGVYDVGTYMYMKSCVLSRPRFRAWFVSREVRWGSTPMCHSRGCGLLSQVSCYEHYNVTVYLWVS